MSRRVVLTQCRSVIFYSNHQQEKAAKVSLKKWQRQANAKIIVTDILPLKEFYPAEEYH
ncbi:MAG: peptide-methionine (S)-S-oxide reductase [Syntrophaceae bacterium]|nr:peptide-methionine (S)-S-oxide reductase [Syntrophaceae bacterium]